MTKGIVPTGTACSVETVTVSKSYKSSPEKAFAAWTVPAALEKWFGPPGYTATVLTHDLREGGSWRFLMEDGAGNRFHHFGSFVEIVPEVRLVFTWASEEQIEGWRDDDGNPTLVTVNFDHCSVGVTVTITHENLASNRARTGLTVGWGEGLSCLGDYLETLGDK